MYLGLNFRIKLSKVLLVAAASVAGVAQAAQQKHVVGRTDVYTDPAMAGFVDRQDGLTTFDYGFSQESLVNAGKNKGEDILAKAIANADNSGVKGLFAEVKDYLSDATVDWAPAGKEYRGCDEGTIAFTIPILSRRQIHLCGLAFREYGNQKSMAQILIHESSHLYGLMKECDATIVEVGAMMISGEGLAFQNGYMSECGF